MLAFSLSSAALLTPQRRWELGACAAWFAVNAAFEIGQHAQVRGPLADVLYQGLGGSAVTRALANHFLCGTFDAGHRPGGHRRGVHRPEHSDFVQLNGPACGSGPSCPDFSASGAPLRFGFERRVGLPASVPAGTIEHGMDNWKISVWRA